MSSRKDVDKNGILYFNTPQRVKGIKNAFMCSSSNDFNYVLAELPTEDPSKKYHQVFSFGFGSNYVLGNKEDDDEREPYEVDYKDIY